MTPADICRVVNCCYPDKKLCCNDPTEWKLAAYSLSEEDAIEHLSKIEKTLVKAWEVYRQTALDSAIKNNPVMSKSVEKRVLVQIQDVVKSLNLHCKTEGEYE